ncbi:MAG: DUF493 domain-containing protein [Deltaproteobacteria bacterium]|nr:DUF493 domain-containing protein [Deltaproteobacteria bacterium]
MPDLPPLISYPVDYEYKVIGRAEADFEGFVRGLVSGALKQPIADSQVEVKPSSAGKFASVRIKVRLENEEQRVAVYTALSNQPRIVFYL